MDQLTGLLAREGLLPHGYCITWSPGLLWSMVTADVAIALAYFSIPLAIVHFVRQRGDTGPKAVPWLFSAFIFACGLTHVMDAWTIWQPVYDLQVVTKLLTAGLSIVTAVALWPLIPRALAIPSVAQLRAAIAALEAEVGKRRSAEEHLLDIEQSLAITLASIGAGFIATDREGRVTRMNAVAEQLTGWTQAQAQGRGVLQVFRRDDRPAGAHDRNPVDELLDRGVTIADASHVTIVGRDGTRTPLQMQAAPRRADDGTVRGLTMVFRDLTALNRAERLEAENRRIQEANRLKSQFLANMSHELRTPLNAIIGFSDLLQSGRMRADAPERQRFLEHIGSSGRHLLQLINDVLDLSKVESGRFEFFPEPVDLAPLVHELRNVLQTSIEGKGLVLETRIDPDLTDLVIDRSRLKQALYNLLSNAIKFTGDGGRIEVRASAEGTQALRIEVEDTGIGIAAADLPRLFVDFQQLDVGLNKRHGGTGLGLALTRRLVEAQGGRVGVHSTPGRGSTFFLLLPRRPGAEVPADGERLLLIEADPAPRELMRRALKVGGRPVEAVGNAGEAMAQAHAHRFDAFTLGLHLPDQPGLALLSELRSRTAHTTTPVLALTLPAAGEIAGFAIADVLAKPIRSEEIVAAMARLPAGGGRPRRVMVVDDDPLARDLMRASLAAMDIEALCLPGGREALAALEHEQPDAIVLDLVMPELDGFATLDALRRLPHGALLPVYIWTSLLLTDEEYAMLARSAQAILRKGGGGLDGVLDALARWRPLQARSDR
jgi:PAS domain S-box-containing protein